MSAAPLLRFRRLLTAALALGLAACEPPSSARLPAPPDRTATLPAQGTDSTLDFGTWNLEWFGDASNGPSDEALQLRNVRDVIAGTDLDLWGLQEVVGRAHFQRLVSQLPGYAGLLADDARVTDGAAYYSGFNGAEQKVGLLYKTSLATVRSARIILGEHDHAFAGRPPLEVKLSATLNGATEDLVVIVLHAKAGAGGADYGRRKAGSDALKAYLDAIYPLQKVIVIGDFNDDVDASIVRPRASPYARFVADSARYRFATRALSDAGLSSTVNHADLVDHHLGTDEFWSAYVAGSARVLRVDQHIAGYGTTTSDHFPVATRYAAGPGAAARR